MINDSVANGIRKVGVTRARDHHLDMFRRTISVFFEKIFMLSYYVNGLENRLY